MSEEFIRYNSEMAICERLTDIARKAMTREQIEAFVSKYGIPWWLEPDEKLIELCPLRFRGSIRKEST